MISKGDVIKLSDGSVGEVLDISGRWGVLCVPWVTVLWANGSVSDVPYDQLVR